MHKRYRLPLPGPQHRLQPAPHPQTHQVAEGFSAVAGRGGGCLQASLGALYDGQQRCRYHTGRWEDVGGSAGYPDGYR